MVAVADNARVDDAGIRRVTKRTAHGLCRERLSTSQRLRACEKSAALGISRSAGARDPHVFQYTLGLLAPSLRLAPAGLVRRFVPDETVLCSGGTRPLFARDDFFTSFELLGGTLRSRKPGSACRAPTLLL
ncbi:MAG: hypothetical protein ACREYE_32270 [Gammaproteobacteria bacterium]